MNPTFKMDDRDMPGKWEICGNCDGNGKHVNRNIDGHGISPEEFAADPEFEQAYFGGVYDVRCDECQGAGKVIAPDYTHWSEDDIQMHEDDIQADADYEAECAAERRFGC